MRAAERPAVRALPQAAQDLEGLLEHVGALVDGREREAVASVLVRVPPGTDADLDPTAAQLVDGGRDLGEVARRAERDRRDEDAEADPVGVTSEPGEHRPGVGGRLIGLAGEALVVVRPEEGLEPGGLGALHDRELVGVAEAHLGLGHQGEPHVVSSA